MTLPMPKSIPGWRVRFCTRAALTLAFAFLLILPASAASFPDRPIKLIVPFAPGGPPDVAARIIGDWLSAHLGPVVVENYVGAGGTLAARMVASAPPDGYTLMAATSGSLAISPQLYKNAGIDPVKDFTAVALLSSTPQVLAINASLPVHSVKELVAYAKANPGKLNYGAVIGTPPHLSGEMFKHLTGTDIVFVPYKGASQATTDVLTGTDEHDLRRRDRHHALSQERQAARARGDEPAPPAGNSRRADHDRSRLPRHAARCLAGDRRAGRHAGRASSTKINARREPGLGRSRR